MKNALVLVISRIEYVIRIGDECRRRYRYPLWHNALLFPYSFSQEKRSEEQGAEEVVEACEKASNWKENTQKEAKPRKGEIGCAPLKKLVSGKEKNVEKEKHENKIGYLDVRIGGDNS